MSAAEAPRRRLWRFVPWKTLLVLLVGIVVVRAWVVDTVVVQTGSMEPYLHGSAEDGDRVVVHKTAFLRRLPQRFEPVVFELDDQEASPYFVKRAVAFGGERVEIRGGDLWVSEPGREELLRVRKDYATFRPLLVPVYRPEWQPPEQVFGASDDCRVEDGVFHLVGAEDPHDAVSCRYDRPVHDGYRDVDGAEVVGPGKVPDLVLRVWFTPEGVDSGFVAELFEGSELFRFTLHPSLRNGRIDVLHQERDQAWLGSHPGFEPGVETCIEIWNVDGAFGVAIDGVVEFTERHAAAKDWMGETSIGPGFGVLGGKGTVSRVEIDRDLYYTPVPGDEPVVRVPADHLFLLGDNSRRSRDSRVFGCVPVSALVGRPISVCLPWDRARWLD